MVNPYQRVAELSYDNNVVICSVFINGPALNVWDCHLTGLPSREELDRALNDAEIPD